MASEGLKLTSFYAQSVCGVSRAALMTGSYPTRVGEPGNAKRLRLDENTLVIFTSDNRPWIETKRGMKANAPAFIPREHSGNADPLRGWKMSGWDGGSRVRRYLWMSSLTALI